LPQTYLWGRVATMSLARAAALPSLVAGVYVCLVLALWAPFGPQNGMPYETALVYVPETTSFFNGYEYLDELRRWTQLFYTVGYRLSDVLGIDGSFLGLQLVYAVLWWARGLLAFLIVRRLLPSPLVAFAAGALVLVHASDHALNWVGQLNQFGVIFWLLLSIYLLVVGLQQKQPLPGVTVWRLAAATETDLAFVEAVFLVPLVILFSMIPITIAGWGVREGAMVSRSVPSASIARAHSRYPCCSVSRSRSRASPAALSGLRRGRGSQPTSRQRSR